MANPAESHNPVTEEVASHSVSSAVAIAGHPIHAMSVAFPIALVIATLGCDLFFWLWGDPFWARAGLWSSGFAFLFGLIAGASGTAELLLVEGIRVRVASWAHAVVAVFLISVAGANWGLRVGDPAEAVLPVGLFLSVLASVFVGFAGWHGGKLVFDHGIGIMIGDTD